MGKRLILLLLCAILLSSVAGVQGADLPIDIDRLGEQAYSGSAITAYFKIDLFSPESRWLTETIGLEKWAARNETSTALFASLVEDVVNTQEQLAAQAADLALFSEPTSHSLKSQPVTDAGLPAMAVVMLLVFGAVGGFFAAIFVRSHRKKGASDVSTPNY